MLGESSVFIEILLTSVMRDKEAVALPGPWFLLCEMRGTDVGEA